MVEPNHSQTKCCAECPFSRKVERGAIGNDDAGVYIGQALGPFFLPCHMDPEYYKDRRSHTLIQCAGAATFRSNIGVSQLMPAFLHTLPADRRMCFASFEEFLVHHLGVTLEKAKQILEEQAPVTLLRREMAKQEVRRTHG